MSENNYGALMMKSSIAANINIDQIISPGIYPVIQGNSTAPDSSSGVLQVYSGPSIQRTYSSPSGIYLLSTYNPTNSVWSAWINPLTALKYGSPLIGELVEWPRAEMPQEIWPDCGMEFIPYMAQSFDAEKYPLLAQLHPTHVLPADMRAEFVRGWDNGRGVNTGQDLMAWAADELKSHNHTFMGRYGGGSSATVMTPENSGTTTTTNNTGGDETRPRSVAWNMIVRAK